MGLKIRHTKRGTSYHGVTGKRKVSLFPKRIKWSSDKKNSKTENSFIYHDSSEYEDGAVKSCCSIIAFIIIIPMVFAFSKCNSKHKTPKHSKSHYNSLRRFPHHQINVNTYIHSNWIYFE